MLLGDMEVEVDQIVMVQMVGTIQVLVEKEFMMLVYMELFG